MTAPRGHLLVTVAVALCALLVQIAPGLTADLGPEPGEQLPKPAPPLSQWQYNFDCLLLACFPFEFVNCLKVRALVVTELPLLAALPFAFGKPMWLTGLALALLPNLAGAASAAQSRAKGAAMTPLPARHQEQKDDC
jgi:hypothetical protein